MEVRLCAEVDCCAFLPFCPLTLSAVGRGFPIRLAFEHAKIAYEDVRLTFPTFNEKKAGYPFAAVPVLRVKDADGERVYAQSNAILRFVGRKAGLYPSDEVRAFQVDEILDAVEDVTNAMSPSISEKDEAVKAEMRKTLATTTFPRYLKGIEEQLTANGPGPFAVGGEVTIADFKLYSMVRHLSSGVLDGIPKDIVDAYPRTLGVFKAVAELQLVKDHLEKHA